MDPAGRPGWLALSRLEPTQQIRGVVGIERQDDLPELVNRQVLNDFSREGGVTRLRTVGATSGASTPNTLLLISTRSMTSMSSAMSAGCRGLTASLRS